MHIPHFANAKSPKWQLAILTVAAAAGSYSRFIFSAVQESARVGMHLTDNQIAVLQGPAVAIPLIIGYVPLGLAIDRYSRRNLILLFAVCAVAGNVLSALTADFLVLCIARSLIWLAMSGTILAVLSTSADLFEPTARGRALMIVSIGQIAGTSLAFMLGGHLVSGLVTTVQAWRWATAWMTLALVPVVPLLLTLREPERTSVEVTHAGASAILTELWKYAPRILTLLTGGVMVGMVDSAIEVWSAPMFSRSFGMSPDQVGNIMGVGLLLGGLVGPIAGGLLSDFSLRSGGPRRVVTALSVLALLSVPVGTYSVMPGSIWATLLFVALYSLGGAIAVIVATMYTVVVPNELRGLCMGISNVIAVPVSIGLAPLVVSGLSEFIGGGHMIGMALALVCTIVSAIGAGAFRFGSRFFPPADSDGEFVAAS